MLDTTSTRVLDNNLFCIQADKVGELRLDVSKEVTLKRKLFKVGTILGPNNIVPCKEMTPIGTWSL